MNIPILKGFENVVINEAFASYDIFAIFSKAIFYEGVKKLIYGVN